MFFHISFCALPLQPVCLAIALTDFVGPKNKKSKRRKDGGKAKPQGDLLKVNGRRPEDDGTNQGDGGNGEELDKPVEKEINPSDVRSIAPEPKSQSIENGVSRESSQTEILAFPSIEARTASDPTFGRDGDAASPEGPPSPRTFQENSIEDPQNDTGARLEALAQERAALKDEVTQLRQSLQKIQEKHEEDMTAIHGELEERTGEKEHAETQYRNLLGKVNTIRSQLGERLKADAVGFEALRSTTVAKL